MVVLQEIAIVCKLLAVSAILLSGAAATTGNYTHQYYVRPNVSSHCPPHQVPCMTLAEYAVHPGQYFTSDTRLVFLSGEHSLNTTLRIGNVTNLAMVGSGGLTPAPVPEHMDLPLEPSSQIRCTASIAGIVFVNCTDLLIQNLTLYRCGNVTTLCSYKYTIALTLINSLPTIRNSLKKQKPCTKV